MSAYLDKSQGITFVYSNIHELYLKAKHAKLDAPFFAERTAAPARKVTMPSPAASAPATGRVLKAHEVKVEEFKPAEIKPEGEQRPYEVPMGVREAEEKSKRLNMRPVAALQKNLSELNDAHEKLRFLLQELESLTGRKKS